LAGGVTVQALVHNDGATGASTLAAGTPVQVALPADAVRVLASGDASVEEIRTETFGDVAPVPA
jgi:hypothetical protein